MKFRSDIFETLFYVDSVFPSTTDG